MQPPDKNNYEARLELLAENIANQFGLKRDSAGFWHVNPYPSPEDLKTFYQSEYFQKVRQTIAPTLDVGELEESHYLFDKRLQILREKLPQKARILDIGSGGGAFLKLASEAGFQAEGIESSEVGLRRTRSLGLKVTEGFFGKGQVFFNTPFDAIHVNFVLEHIAHPRDFLLEIKRCLKPGGIVICAVPNDFNPYQLAYVAGGNKPWWVVPREHLNYFSPTSLRNIFEECGFYVSEVSTGFPIDQFLLMGEDYVNNGALGGICHKRRKMFAESLRKAGMEELLEKQNKALAQLGIGRDILLFAQA